MAFPTGWGRRQEYTLPTVNSLSDFPIVLKTEDFEPDSLNGHTHGSYGLKWTAEGQGLEVTGIVGAATLELTLLNDMTDKEDAFGYLFDARKSPGTEVSSGHVGAVYDSSGTWTMFGTGVHDLELNDVNIESTINTSLDAAVAGDTIKVTVDDCGGTLIVGSRFTPYGAGTNKYETIHGVGLYGISITDDNGTHLLLPTATGSSFQSDTGYLTATLVDAYSTGDLSRIPGWSYKNGGGDLRISTDVDGYNEIPLEIVDFVTGATPSVEVHCKVPSLATGGKLYFWGHKSDAIARGPTEEFGSQAVWGDWRNIAHAQDLKDSTGGTDFTALSGSPTVTSAGYIGGAFEAGGGGSYEIVGDTGITGSSARTVTAWVDRRNQSGAEAVIVEWGTDTSGGRWTLRYSSGKLRAEFNGCWVEATAANSADTYYKVTAVQKGTDTDSIDLYQNDTLLTVNRSANTTINTVAGSNFTIFESPHIADRFLNGFIDELRIIGSALSADWIATEYDNQSHTGSSWGTIGAWEDPFAAPAGVIGSAAHQATAATHAAIGERTVTGAGTHQATAATHAATGERTVTGAGTHQATAATHAATGERTVTGAGTHQATAATHAATGERTVTGAGTHQATAATHAATGAIDGANTGTGAHQATAATHAATGERTVTGSATHQAEYATQTGVGLRVITGGGSHQAAAATQAATGFAGASINGTAAHQASAATHAATGLRLIGGTAAPQAAPATHAATGEREVAGTGAYAATAATHAATGLRVVTGTGAHQAAPATQFGGFIPIAPPVDSDSAQALLASWEPLPLRADYDAMTIVA